MDKVGSIVTVITYAATQKRGRRRIVAVAKQTQTMTKPMRPSTLFRLKLLLQANTIIAFAVAAMNSPAANLTWDADAATTGAQDGSGVWDTTANNWWTGSANTTWNAATGDQAVFGAAGGTAGTVTLGANVVSSNITFNAASVGIYTIAGGGFTLGQTNRTITANASATISAKIAGGSLTLANSGASAPSAVLTLSGDNSFTNFNLGSNAGNTTAAVRANSSTAFGVATGVIGIAGGQGSLTSHRIELAGSGLTISNSIPGNLGRNTPTAVIVNLGSGNTWAGRLTRSTGGQDCAIQSEVANGLTFNGVNGGGIAFSSEAGIPRNFVLRGTGGGTISGVISNGNAAASRNLGIVKYGSGTWTLSGANTFTNGVIVNEGTLTLDYSTQDNSKLPDQGPLTLGGGTVNLSGGTHTEVVFSTPILGGSSSITRSSGAATLRLNALNRSRGGVVNFGAASIADTDTLNGNGILGGWATVAGADWAVNSTGAADGPITAYTGYTDIAAGGSTIADGATSNVRLNSNGSGNISLGGSTTTTINTLLQNNPSFTAVIDTAGKTLRLGTTGAVLVPSGKGTLIIGTAANSGTLTAGGSDNTAGEIILTTYGSAMQISSVIADNGTGPVSLTKAGSGLVGLMANNTHTGTNTIAGGTLVISSDANLGTAPGAATPGTILINGGVLEAAADISLNANRGIALGPTSRYGNGTISVASGVTFTIPGIIANADTTGNGPGASLTKTGPGTLVLGGVNTYSSGTIISGGTVSVTTSGNLGPTPGCYIPDNIVVNGGTLEAAATLTLGGIRGILLGPIGASGGGTFQVDDTFTLQLDSRIADNWNGTGSFTKSGPGTLVLTSGLNDYSGDTTVNAGTLQLGHARAIPNGPGKGNLVLNGTLNVNNFSAGINGLSGSGVLDNQNTGAASLNVGHNNASSTFGGTIQSTGGGALSLSKAGSGTLTLTGPILHNGATVIANGVLALAGSASPGATTNITVLSGATLNVSGLAGGLTLASGQTLAGNGAIVGSVTDTGGAIIAPGTSAGTLAVSGNLTLNGGGTLNYELNNITTTGSGVNDLIAVAGNLDLAGPTTLNLTYLSGSPAVGTYTLIQYGSFSGNLANLTPPPGFALNNNTLAQTIELLVTHSPATLTWRGDDTANSWDIGTTANWIQDGTNQFFFTGDSAIFDDTGSNSPSINLTGTIFPSAVTVNAVQDYTFAGSSIATGSLTKNNTGTLILENDNTYAGPTVIGAGNLQVGNGTTTGRIGTGPVTNNGALIFNRADDLTVANAISGSGLVTQFGSATVGLTASNSYAGGTTINSGILAARNGAALGTAAAGTLVNPGGQLLIDANVNITNESLSLSGAGPGNGALRKGGGGATVWTGPVFIMSDAMLQIDGGATLSLINAGGITGSDTPLTLAGDGGGQGFVTGPISIGDVALTKSGAGNWTVAATNNYTGRTVIEGGTLFVRAVTALGPISAFAADYVHLNGGSLGVTNDLAFNDGLRGFTAVAGGFNVGAGATLTVSNDITGAGTLTKSGAGTLVLIGAKSFAGTLNVDTAATGGSDGSVRLTSSAVIANIPATPGVATILQRNNNNAFSTLQLDGSAGSIVIPQDVQLSCRNVTNYTLQNLAGSNVFTGGVLIQSGGADQWWQSDSGTLTFASSINYVGTLLGARTYHFQGPGNFRVTGNINASPLNPPYGSAIRLTKDGAGTLTLAGVNTYAGISTNADNSLTLGTTTISNGVLLLTGSITHNSGGAVTVAGGTLAGTGTINAPVNVLAGGTLAPGASIGTLTIRSNLTLAGTTSLEINKSTGLRDQVIGLPSVTYGGTLVVTNLAGTLNLGDSFTVFSAGSFTGNFTNVTGSAGPGLAYSFNPTNGTVRLVVGIPSTPTNLLYSATGGNLTLNWPASYVGWILQAQTNTLNVGISNNWVDVPGSAATNSVTFPIRAVNPTVFFRLRHP
jgi:fibronectin-binding autotransporter adhesin